VAAAVPRGPFHDHHPPIEEPDRDQPPLAIIEPLVIIFDEGAGEHLFGVAKSSPRAASVQSRFDGSKVTGT
jgi:hypothetical protein